MMTGDGTWRENFAINVYETDFTGRLRLSTLFNYFQEVAGNHVEHLGIGYEALKKFGFVWVLARARVRVRKPPSWGKNVALETWHAATDGLMFIRDFRMRDEEGAVMIVATTGWLLMDIKTFRPHAAEGLPIPLPANDHGRALDEPMKKLLPVQGLRPSYERNVHLSDIDVNGHVNNARYLEWIFDCYDTEFVQSHVIGSVQVNYVSESILGDTIALFRGEESSAPGVHYIEGVSQKKGAKVIQALVTWENSGS